jgi:hypothetical protein
MTGPVRATRQPRPRAVLARRRSTVTNISAGALNEQPVVQFTVIKGGHIMTDDKTDNGVAQLEDVQAA